MTESAGTKKATCRSCGAEIIWVVTGKGKNQPLDAKSEKRTILMPLPDGKLMGQLVDTYMPHHATCPDAVRWRRNG